jgi:hypothetical protein
MYNVSLRTLEYWCKTEVLSQIMLPGGNYRYVTCEVAIQAAVRRFVTKRVGQLARELGVTPQSLHRELRNAEVPLKELAVRGAVVESDDYRRYLLEKHYAEN